MTSHENVQLMKCGVFAQSSWGAMLPHWM